MTGTGAGPAGGRLPLADSESIKSSGEAAVARLLQQAAAQGECDVGLGGAVLAFTGKKTGRSAQDKFMVAGEPRSEAIWWKHQKRMAPEAFIRLRTDMLAYLSGRNPVSQDLSACADPQFRLDVRVVCELAWQALFIRHLLRDDAGSNAVTFEPEWTVLCCPGFMADPARHGCASETVITISVPDRTVLIGGTGYAGEIKKSVFTVLNLLLPGKGVLPMHCAANHAIGNPDDSALFFGLSGTGKTTLSADPRRTLIGDDEHGWSDSGVFNFEGGCYAKTFGLSAEAEPHIHATTSMFGTVVENVAYDPPTRRLDFADGTLTENGRCAYPLDAIPFASATGRAGHPTNVFMLTCDSFGVLPAISRLTPDQAVRHFLAGFTSRISGTERGAAGVQPVFSPCFGHPFLPLKPQAYGDLFRAKIDAHGPRCWLVNTGWIGGGYGSGSRIALGTTRALVKAALDGNLAKAECRTDANFGLEVPLSAPGAPSEILWPRSTWSDPGEYDAAAARLAELFEENDRTLAAI